MPSPAKSLLLISCEEQLKEFKHIALTNEKVKQMLSSKPENYIKLILGITQLSETKKRFSLLHDYKDNYLIDLCWQTQSILVSDDSGFAPLKKMQRSKVKVISKKDFYELVGW